MSATIHDTSTITPRTRGIPKHNTIPTPLPSSPPPTSPPPPPRPISASPAFTTFTKTNTTDRRYQHQHYHRHYEHHHPNHPSKCSYLAKTSMLTPSIPMSSNSPNPCASIAPGAATVAPVGKSVVPGRNACQGFIQTEAAKVLVGSHAGFIYNYSSFKQTKKHVSW